MSLLAHDLFETSETISTRYLGEHRGLVRQISTPSGRRVSSVAGQGVTIVGEGYDAAWLRSASWPELSRQRSKIAVADLFSGSGGMTLGAWEAARALELELQPVLAIDNDEDAISVYRRNFEPERSFACGIEEVVDGELGAPTTEAERRMARGLSTLDLLLAGPPCQGHSDLNNHTRREDPRNALVMRVARFAELFSPTHIVVENVQGVRHDRSEAFARCRAKLETLGYGVELFLLQGAEVGVPQRRRRCFMVASRRATIGLEGLSGHFSSHERTFDWACGDLGLGEGVFDTAANVSSTNAARMRFLIDNDLFELPNSERPDCHRLKPHGYASVYGRLRPDAAAPTITTGFGSPGQGRYTHPREPRTLTPHEAARLQFFPDFFDFGVTMRKRLQKLIGNAVPPKLIYPILLELLA